MCTLTAALYHKVMLAFHGLCICRYPREVGANPNHYIFDDLERHIAEIAAFNLDRYDNRIRCLLTNHDVVQNI